MNVFGRLDRAYSAFIAGSPSKDAVSLRSMPKGAMAREIRESNQKRKHRIARNPTSYRLFEPTMIQAALDAANGSGILSGPFGAASVAEWVRSNPVVHGVTSGLTDFTHLPVGVKHSEEAAAWLEGTPTCQGMRTKICDPSELENMASNRHHAGWCIGLMIWNDYKGHPEFQSLDPAGVRYIPGEDRYEYHGWRQVFKIEPGNGIWVFDGLLKNAPWREGAAFRLGNDNYAAINAAGLEALWQQAFSIPWVWAVAPQGASDPQKARFWNSAIGGAALRVLGVSPGYDMKFLQASAEGKDSFAQTVQRLREHASIDTYGTIGLLAGGAGFSNSDLFEIARDGKREIEAFRQSRMENPQIWQPVLDWAVRSRQLSPAARYAFLEYLIETPASIARKAKAAKDLIDCGYTPEEAQRRVGLQKQAVPGVKETTGASAPIFAYHIQGGIVTPNEVRNTLGLEPKPGGDTLPTVAVQPTQPPPLAMELSTEPREEEAPEPHYSETIANALNERGEDVCPCDRHETRSCPRCGVTRRPMMKDGQWANMWQPRRRAA